MKRTANTRCNNGPSHRRARPECPEGQLIINPVLPHWLPGIALRHLRVGQAAIDLPFWREGDTTWYDVLSVDGELSVT